MRPAETYRPTSVLLVENDSMDAQRLTQQLTLSPPDVALGDSFAVEQQFPEACKSQHSSSIPTCLFVNLHAKMGLS